MLGNKNFYCDNPFKTKEVSFYFTGGVCLAPCRYDIRKAYIELGILRGICFYTKSYLHDVPTRLHASCRYDNYLELCLPIERKASLEVKTIHKVEVTKGYIIEKLKSKGFIGLANMMNTKTSKSIICFPGAQVTITQFS